MQAALALLAGLVFGAGLAVAQMIDPGKVLAFLDVGAIAAGAWDPSLAFVMAGALAVTAPLFAHARRRGRPFLGGANAFPSGTGIDRRLIAGALLFGAGWGLVGYCPGPAIAAIGLGQAKTLGFIAAMATGMALHHVTAARR